MESLSSLSFATVLFFLNYEVHICMIRGITPDRILQIKELHKWANVPEQRHAIATANHICSPNSFTYGRICQSSGMRERQQNSQST